MKLVLHLSCPSYELARALHRDLGKRGFDAGVVSPSTNVWEVVVTSRRETSNVYDNPFDELQTAYAVASVFLRENV